MKLLTAALKNSETKADAGFGWEDVQMPDMAFSTLGGG